MTGDRDAPPGNGLVDTTAYAVLYLLWEDDAVETVRDLNKATSDDVTKDAINGALGRLEEAGYIEVDRPDGRTEEWIDGRRVTYPCPKTATVTDAGIAYVDWATQQTRPPATVVGGDTDVDGFADLAQRVERLEGRLDRLEAEYDQRFQQLREQVLDALEDRTD